jgi:hypothetical protein
VLKANQFSLFPVIRIAGYNPIVATVSLTIALAKGRDFLLPTKNRFHAMRMQIAVGVHVSLCYNNRKE